MNPLKTSSLYQQLRQASREQQPALRPLDFHIGVFLAELDPDQSPALLLAASLTSAAVAAGHVCLPLQKLSGHSLSEKAGLSDPGQWASALRKTAVVGVPGDLCPLILDRSQRLYLFRYHQYETRIAARLLQCAGLKLKPDLQLARRALQELAENGQLDKGQQTAAALALLKGLVLISGGPGTGKTHTLAYTLALIQSLQAETAAAPLRIALAAPTGRAAARMKESIRRARASMSERVSSAVPDDAQTLHRLLGLRPGADDFRYNESNPLHIDILVVDEASMIDTVMMDGLLRALPPHCRLILMGDHHQLPSVEAGKLFTDLCSQNTRPGEYSAGLATDLQSLTGKTIPVSTQVSPVSDSIARLLTNHRQADADGLSDLAQAVDKGSMNKIQQVFSAGHSNLVAKPLTGEARIDWLANTIKSEYQHLLNAGSLNTAFDKMEGFRLLCAVREGPMGVAGVNELAETLLKQPGRRDRNAANYPGKPIIIRQNHYRMRLYNGDTGLLWEDPEDGHQLKAWFRNADRKLISHSISRLPAFDSAYAITVHQAQGSEFKRVLLLLPEDESRVLSRELLYTGVTRARDTLSLCYDEQTLAFAIARRNERDSGLHELLIDAAQT